MVVVLPGRWPKRLNGVFRFDSEFRAITAGSRWLGYAPGLIQRMVAVHRFLQPVFEPFFSVFPD